MKHMNFNDSLGLLPKTPNNVIKATQPSAELDKIKYFVDTKVDRINSVIYNLADKDDLKKYTKDKKKLYIGTVNGSLILTYSDKQFVPNKTTGTGTWMAHLEWVEISKVKTKK